MTALKSLKEAQLALILKHNPMTDDIHLGIRKLSDIKTFAEVVNDDESFVYGDFSQQDALNALNAGIITVYSSKSINIGDFVSTSHRMVKDYAGSGRVNQRTVKLTDVAWINGDEGVYTGPIKEEKNMPIKIETKVVLSEKLKTSLTKLASKYYPEGDIVVHGPTSTGLLLANYHPTPQEYTTLTIQVIGGEIVRLGSRYDEDTDPKLIAFKNAFNEAKKRVTTTQPAGNKTSEANEENKMNKIRIERSQLITGKLRADLIKLASKYYPSGVIEGGETYVGNLRLCVYIPDDPEYRAMNITIISGSISTVGDLMGKDTNPKARAFIDAFNKAKAKANTEAKKSALTPHIKVDDFKGVSEALKTNLITAAGKYYPEGNIRIFENGEVRYYPESNKYPQVALLYSKNNVVRVVSTDTLNKTSNAPRVQPKPQLPTIDLTKFSGVMTPKSAHHYATGRANNYTVELSITFDTDTSYLQVTLGDKKHRFMGKSDEEIVRKLEDFLVVSTGTLLQALCDAKKYENSNKFMYSIDAQKVANFLAQCPIKK